MSDKELNKLLCKEMSEVCLMLADYVKDKKQKKGFEQRAEIFKAIGKNDS